MALEAQSARFTAERRTGEEKEKPPFIQWMPSLRVPSALILDRHGKEVQERDNDQWHICRCNNACGIGALAAVFRTREPDLTANDVYVQAETLGLSAREEGLTASQLTIVVNSKLGWHALTEKPGDDVHAETIIRSALGLWKYPISGVQANGATGRIESPGSGHWVVVSAVSESSQWARGEAWQWIRVMNPFDNEEEYYPWSYAWKRMWLDSTKNHPILLVWYKVPFSVSISR